MNRLIFELNERKRHISSFGKARSYDNRLRGELQELTTRKRQLEEETARKKAFLSRLQPQLESLAEVCGELWDLLHVLQ